MQSYDKSDISVYIHIPFSIKARKGDDTLVIPSTRETRNAYLKALERELMSAGDIFQGRRVASIHIGGGIATTVSPDKLARLLLNFKRSYDVASNVELTVTAAPQTLVSPCLSGLNMGGINRISLVALSPIDKLLETIDAPHRLDDIENGTFILTKFGYSNVDAVIMYGIPGQTLTSIRNTLSAFISLKGLKHITLKRYELAEQAGVSMDDCEAHYTSAVDLLSSKGLKQYTTDSFAHPGWESHFTTHTLLGMERAGFGLGAKTFFKDMVSQNTTDFNCYLQNSADLTKIVSGAIELSELDRVKRFVALRLQLVDGFSENDYLSEFGSQPGKAFSSVVDAAMSTGLVSQSEGSYRLTHKGLMHSDKVISSILGS
ncbi:MAG: hypothetical protein JXA42_11855 [Anaerolineales bacterium]|nr:hypothetical protein [Anaerolineales bacterium]